VYTSLFSYLKRYRSFIFFCLLSVCLGSCSGAVDDIKDLFAKDLYGAIGFKPGADPIIAPADAGCMPDPAKPATNVPGGRCLSSAEASNAVLKQCPDCKLVLEFKGTNESTFCGSIALSATKLAYGAASDNAAKTSQEKAMLACEKAEGTSGASSTCKLVKTRCL
jgi:phage FluMu protein Com